ncbi:MAG: c-type cytochrome, partial [Geminicoccaceae bacterium]
FMHEGVPKAYRGLASTVAIDDQTIDEGGSLYARHCASCHGSTGRGDGEAGKALSPSPALLDHMIRSPMAADEYLFWTIAEGGARFETDMPAHKDKLQADEIWKIIAFMRAGFPGMATDNKQ